MSIDAIAELVRQLELPADGVSLRAGFSVRDELDARLAVAVGEFDAAGSFGLDGAVSTQAWLRAETGRNPSAASTVTATGRKLRALPVLRSAVLSGLLTGGQLDVVVANVPRRHVAAFAEMEADIIPTLVGLTVDETRMVLASWRAHADAVDDGKPPVERDNQLHLSKTLDSRGELRGSFDADGTAIIDAALRVADNGDLDTPGPVRRADALTQICQHFLDHQQTKRGGRHRPHLNVKIDWDQFHAGTGGTYIDTNQPVSPATLGVLRCDSAYHRLLLDSPSANLDYGRSTRAWPVDIYNAVMLRDSGCRYPGCDAPPSWCDIHHITEWDHGGPTSIDNGAMFCRRHHHRIHANREHVKLLPDHAIEITDTDGKVKTSRPHGETATLWRHRPPAGSRSLP